MHEETGFKVVEGNVIIVQLIYNSVNINEKAGQQPETLLEVG